MGIAFQVGSKTCSISNNLQHWCQLVPDQPTDYICMYMYTRITSVYSIFMQILPQLVDDLLDFTSSESVMGKPTAADLKLGLATAPVLYAAQEVIYIIFKWLKLLHFVLKANALPNILCLSAPWAARDDHAAFLPRSWRWYCQTSSLSGNLRLVHVLL